MNINVVILIVICMLIGVEWGVFYGPVLDYPILGVALGALAGLFVGGFLAAIALEIKKSRESTGTDPNSAGSDNSPKKPDQD